MRIEPYLVIQWRVSEPVAHYFTQRNPALTIEQAAEFMRSVMAAFQERHIESYCEEIAPAVLSVAVELAMLRAAATLQPIDEADIKDLLPKARERVAAPIVKRIEYKAEQLKAILAPLRKAIAGEPDDKFRGRLEFIAGAFENGGLIWDKKLLFSACMNRQELFTMRKVIDALETLHTQYEAIGVIRGRQGDATVFVMPDYLEI